MKLVLPCGKEARLGVAHVQTQSPEHVPHIRRGTRVWLLFDDVEHQATSVCRPPDQFTKAEGRRMAANKLLVQLQGRKVAHQPNPAHPLLSKEDRREVFLRICPEYAPKLSKKEFKHWERNGHAKIDKLRGVLGEVSNLLGLWIDTGLITNTQPLEHVNKVLEETK